MTAFFLQQTILSRPAGDFNSRSFETQIRSFPVLMAFLRFGWPEVATDLPSIAPLEMGFESPRIVPEQSRDLP
jgi:hypothetical protein